MSVVFTAPGMFVSGVISVVEHREKLSAHIILLLLCYTCGCISGVSYLRYSYFHNETVTSPADFLTLIFIGLMAAAVMMDLIWQEIYEFVWIVSATGGGICLLMNEHLSVEMIISLAICFLIQEVFMRYVYGRADCHAFCCSSLYLALMGLKLEYYALHMTITWIMLIVGQAATGNINFKLRLKQPVPMLPYIASGLFLITAFVHFP